MIIAGIFPLFGALLATLPDAVLGGCTLMMFGTIVISGLQMISNCGYSQRNITIAALSLSIGIGFTQVPEIFSIFPKIIENVFSENCVAVVFNVSIFCRLFIYYFFSSPNQHYSSYQTGCYSHFCHFIFLRFHLKFRLLFAKRNIFLQI